MDEFKKDLIRFISDYQTLKEFDGIDDLCDDLIDKLEQIKILHSMALFDNAIRMINELPKMINIYLPETIWNTVDVFIRDDKLINAIKEYRAITGDSLRDSKIAVEKRRDDIQAYIKTK